MLLLAHPRILKAGRLVDADLNYLRNACHSPNAFVDGLDLAKYAKERRVVSNVSKCGLTDLCAAVLTKRLNKNVSERISQAWEDKNLTSEQKLYAAKDAVVSLLVYRELSKLDCPKLLPDSLHPFIPVLLLSADNMTVIAEGQISIHLTACRYDDINVTRTRTVIDILKVLVPGAKIKTHKDHSLESFGPPPFSVVCLKSHLRTFDPTAIPTVPPPTIPHAQGSSTAPVPALVPDEDEQEFASIGDLLNSDLSGPVLSDALRHPDPASAALGDAILGPNPDSWDPTIHSRVLKDPWHIFHMFYISAKRGIRAQFTRELRDAIFIPDKTDRARINAWGSVQNPPRTYEALRNSNPEWLRHHCKHIIPPPKILYPLVAQVFRTYGPLVILIRRSHFSLLTTGRLRSMFWISSEMAMCLTLLVLHCTQLSDWMPKQEGFHCTTVHRELTQLKGVFTPISVRAYRSSAHRFVMCNQFRLTMSFGTILW